VADASLECLLESLGIPDAIIEMRSEKGFILGRKNQRDSL